MNELLEERVFCKSCKQEIESDSTFCRYCGRKQTRGGNKKRGNGQGTVVKLPNGKYRATITIGYYLGEDGKMKRLTRSREFVKRKDAIEILPTLKKEPQKKKVFMTFRELYEKWLPTHQASKSTLDCYKAAFKYFRPVWYLKMCDIDIDDLQECFDECEKGKRTKENMKALCGLVYKYGIPRQAIPNNLNLSQFIRITGEEGAAHRESLTDIEIEKIKQNIGLVEYADYIYCMIYLGFRPSEFLSLTRANLDLENLVIRAGAKTEAGKGRAVTISPKIEQIIRQRAAAGEILFPNAGGNEWQLRDFTDNAFYPALEAIGIHNPIVKIAGDVDRHRITPHSCRHTFSTLMKNINAPSKDKLELMGHTSEEMLRYYQDVNLQDLKKITDAL